ncbi:MAG: ABC transporter substrate-binding protein [SAR202 cluster bacterium]|jgi:ABC-type branched-subunit amino acid transport system substrate-binding protein|nr:ABC transporter substrate-binding protein [SAR202 cluster bacterium]|tara:strand:- start:23755 stop:24981 length:1227 start_codon:yes stop_codon:yes gene_type:complete
MQRFNKATMVVVAAVASLVLVSCGGGNNASGPLKIGSLLPETGSLAFLGPPEFAGVDLAVEEINAAGGVLGENIEHIRGDSGDTSSDIAQQTTDSHISAGVSAIVGAASSGVSFTVIDKIASAEIVHFSPANTSPDFTNYEDDGYYFRTAPSDTFQGAVLGQLMAKEGAKNAVFLNLDDAYGNGLAKYASAAFTGTSTNIVYNPQAAEFSADVAKAKAANPDAIALIGFDETAKIFTELIKQGIGPDKVKTYLVDGNLSSGAYKDLPAGIMTGVKATLPGVFADGTLQKRLLGVDPALTDFSYAPESYDAIILIALAAEQGGSTDGKTIRDNLVSVSKGGTKCTTFADCKALIADGEDIDYDGVSGPVEFGNNGDPSYATMGIYQYTANDKYVALPAEFISGDVPAGE